MKVVVTGAAGFIGSAVCATLLERGDQVVGVDNFDPFYDIEIKRRNVQRCEQHKGFEFHEGDIVDGGADKAIEEADGLIHLAALAGVRPSLLSPLRYFRVNIEGTVRLLEACRKSNVRRVVCASSSSVYGARTSEPFHEDDNCDVPQSPYAASKRGMEIACANQNRLYGTGITCLRYFTVYGPGQRPEMAIHKFARMIRQGTPIEMFGDGTSGRDYTYIDDIVRGTLAAFDRQSGNFRIYNLGGRRPVQLRDLIERIGKAVGREPIIEEKPMQPGDVPYTCANVERAQSELGFRAEVTLDQGLERFVAWLNEQPV